EALASPLRCEGRLRAPFARSLTDSSVKKRLQILRFSRLDRRNTTRVGAWTNPARAAGGCARRAAPRRKVIAMPKFSRVALVLAAASLATVLVHTKSGHVVTAVSTPAQAATTGITFETPTLGDPIHTF